MSNLDWIILATTLIFIVSYGTIKTKKSKDIDGYLKGDNSMKWWMIGVSIMATQASAVTFLSTPGQAVEDGMRFLQFYFGLPLAIIIIAITMVPIYYRLKVFTAYEYLESRFDPKTRILAASLFLLLRGLSAGITLYAPSLVLSTILHWNILWTTVLIGILVIIYTVSGGTRAVSLTQRQQIAVVFGGMIFAGVVAYRLLPPSLSFGQVWQVAGELDALNIVTTDFSWNDRFNIWSGLIASTFLFLAYFGTDQSQVARYLSGQSMAESRMGLIFNGLIKIPMQFGILFIGVLVFVFFQFHQPPVFHNQTLMDSALETQGRTEILSLEKDYNNLYEQKRKVVDELVVGVQNEDRQIIDQSKIKYREIKSAEKSIREEVKTKIKEVIPLAKTNDRDYIFLNFVMRNLPHGLVGLIIAAMFSAAMSSLSSELNALSSTSTVDIYKRLIVKDSTPKNYLFVSKAFTAMWALIAMSFAILANQAENLIQFVNIVGSLFYGTILGIFLVAFYIKRIKSNAVFYAAIVSELIVLICFFFFYEELAFMYYSIIGCLVVLVLSFVLEKTIFNNNAVKVT